MASARRPVDDVPALQWAEAGAECAAEVAALAAMSFDPRYREAWNSLQIASLIGGGAAWLDIARNANGEIAAFALCRIAVDEVELLLCATHPAMRRMGIGRQLMRRVRDASAARGCSRLFLEVRDGNIPALSLYMAQGFAVSGRRPGYYLTTEGERIDALTLLLEVG